MLVFDLFNPTNLHIDNCSIHSFNKYSSLNLSHTTFIFFIHFNNNNLLTKCSPTPSSSCLLFTPKTLSNQPCFSDPNINGSSGCILLKSKSSSELPELLNLSPLKFTNAQKMSHLISPIPNLWGCSKNFLSTWKDLFQATSQFMSITKTEDKSKEQ